MRHGARRSIVLLRSEIPHHPTNTCEEQYETDHAPNNNPSSRAIADEFFMRPILGVSDFLARPIRAGGPGRPPKNAAI
jgi:hypothetical protein